MFPDESQRTLTLQGASNFRDLGGYHGADGRAVRWHTVFRSDHLAALTAPDQQALQTLAIRRVIDFRGVQERAATPDRLLGADSVSVPIEPTVFRAIEERLEKKEDVSAPRMVVLMEQTYRDFVRRDAVQFAQLFAHLRESATPLVFHCTAGKDRTGFAAAMLLLALGVSRETVMEDYLLTNRCYRAPPIPDDARLSHDALGVLWGVRAGFLAAALDAIDTDFGGTDTYLASQLGLDRTGREKLVNAYLSA